MNDYLNVTSDRKRMKTLIVNSSEGTDERLL